MNSRVNLAVQLPESMKTRLDALAKETRQEQGFLIEQAIDRFLELEEKQPRMVREAIDQAEMHPERLIDDASVEAWVESLDSDAELPAPHIKP